MSSFSSYAFLKFCFPCDVDVADQFSASLGHSSSSHLNNPATVSVSFYTMGMPCLGILTKVPGLGIGACLVSFAILIVTLIGVRVYLVLQNKRRESTRQQMSGQVEDHATSEFDFKNLTDKQNPLFVYAY